MSIKLSDSIRVGQQKPLEDKYFNELVPYTSTSQVNTLLPKAVRHIGLTVNINKEEYWYKDGIEDSNLVLKNINVNTYASKNQEQDDRLTDIESENIAQDDLINDLQTSLNNKLDKGTYTRTAQDLKNDIDGKANISHTHNISSINNLQTALDGKQNNITLTTTGNNGSATLVGNTVNVPTYTLAGLGGVPTTITLTINGNTQDLSTNRTFNVETVTSVSASSPLLSTGGNTPTISIQQANGSQSGFLSSTDWNTFNSKQNNLNYTPENITNKSDSYTESSSTTYASTKALVDGLATKLDKGTYTETAQDLKNSIDGKLNKPTTTSTTASYPYVVGEDGNGNSARLPAGDLGKNFFNSDLSNTTARNHTMNAGVTVNTLGNPHALSGLPNKNTDIANFRKVRVQNTNGLDSVVDSKNLLTDGVTSMTDAEKDAWRLAQRKTGETYNTNTPQISVVNPFLIKNTDDFPLAVVVTGSNLFIDLANSIVTMKRVKDSNGNAVSDAEINITQYVTNSEANNLILLIYYNFYNATTGYYELKIQNQYGLQTLTSPQFLVVENYGLTPMLPFTVINSTNQLVDNTTINNNSFEVNLVPNVYGGILFNKLYDSINGDINCIFDLDLAIRIPRSDYQFGEIFLGLINNDSTNNISLTTFPKIGFKIYNPNSWSAKITDVNTNNVLHTFYWTNNDLIYYSKLKIFIKDGTYTITNTITGEVSQGFYNDFNELRFLISKTYSTSMDGGKVTVSVSNFKKI